MILPVKPSASSTSLAEAPATSLPRPAWFNDWPAGVAHTVFNVGTAGGGGTLWARLSRSRLLQNKTLQSKVQLTAWPRFTAIAATTQSPAAVSLNEGCGNSFP
jgi:hypothetical protein